MEVKEKVKTKERVKTESRLRTLIKTPIQTQMGFQFQPLKQIPPPPPASYPIIPVFTDIFKKSKEEPQILVPFKPKYKPSVEALVFGIRGKRRPFAELSGLGLRPLPMGVGKIAKKKKRSKKR